MALTLRGDGTGTAFLVNSAWWNDYYNLLTGTMTDQPVSLYYAPGSAGSTPTLKLRTNNNADLIQGYDGANTKVFSVDRFGAAVLAGAVTAPQFNYTTALGGANKQILRMNPSDKTQQWGLYYLTSGDLSFFEAVGNKTTLTIKASGDIAVANNLTLGGTTISGPNGGQVQLGTTVAGDILIVPGTGSTKFNSGGTTLIDSSGNFQNPKGIGIVLANDNNTGTKVIRIFIGTTDPSTYTTVNDGDIWIKG